MTAMCGAMAGGVILISLDDMLIAEDLAQAIAEVAPQIEIIKLPRRKASAAVFAEWGRAAVVFVQDEAGGAGSSPYVTPPGTAGPRIVLTGGRCAREAARSGHEALPFPFSASEVHALVLRALPPKE